MYIHTYTTVDIYRSMSWIHDAENGAFDSPWYKYIRSVPELLSLFIERKHKRY